MWMQYLFKGVCISVSHVYLKLQMYHSIAKYGHVEMLLIFLLILKDTLQPRLDNLMLYEQFK